MLKALTAPTPSSSARPAYARVTAIQRRIGIFPEYTIDAPPPGPWGFPFSRFTADCDTVIGIGDLVAVTPDPDLIDVARLRPATTEALLRQIFPARS